jgi:serine/threonine protein kinase
MTPRVEEQSPIGSVVGTYRLLELLGEGGMGRVYLAEHVKLGRRVAVKMLRPEFASNPIAVSRFFSEARSVNRISHENIVEITDFLEKPGGDNCYIMELLRGEDLARRIERERFLPLPATLQIATQIANALSAVHAAGIVHRDLKPDNVFLIERSGNPYFVKLLDFGVAKLIDPATAGMQMHTTGAGQIIGTPEYMAPEQAAGQDVGPRSDIYALGVVLYRLTTGTLPFVAKNLGDLVYQHLTTPAARPSSHSNLPHVIPPALDELIVQLLAKDPAERPDAGPVEERLRELLDELEVPLPRAWKPSGQHRTVPSGEIPIVSKTDPNARKHTPMETAPTLDTEVARTGPTPVVMPSAPQRKRTYVVAAAGAAVAAIAIVAVVMARGLGDEPAPATKPAEPAARVATPPPPPSPPPVTVVKIRFTSVPAGATVRIADSDKPLGVTPFVSTLPRSDATTTFEIAKDGFTPVTEQLVLSGDGAVTAALTALPQVAEPPPPKLPAKTPPKRAPKAPPKDDKKTPSLDPSGTMDVFGGGK